MDSQGVIGAVVDPVYFEISPYKLSLLYLISISCWRRGITDIMDEKDEEEKPDWKLFDRNEKKIEQAFLKLKQLLFQPAFSPSSASISQSKEFQFLTSLSIDLSPQTCTLRLFRLFMIQKQQDRFEIWQDCLQQFILNQIQIHHRFGEPSCHQLGQSLEKWMKKQSAMIPFQPFITLLKNQMKRTLCFISISADTLYNYLRDATRLFQDPTVDQSQLSSPSLGGAALTSESVCGLFCRKMSLAFLRLSFYTCCELVTALQRYMHASLVAPIKGSPTAPANTFCDAQDSHPVLISPLQLAQDAANILRLGGAIDAGVAATILSHVERSSVMDQAQLHYVRFVLALCQLNFEEAEARLHHHFDLLINRPHSRIPMSQGREGNREGGVSETNCLLTYAALSKSALYYRFGYIQQGQCMVLEAMRAAQEYADASCVAHCLSWVAVYEQYQGNGSCSIYRALMEKIQHQAKQLGMRQLLGEQALRAAESERDRQPLTLSSMTSEQSPALLFWHQLSQVEATDIESASLQQGAHKAFPTSAAQAAQAASSAKAALADGSSLKNPLALAKPSVANQLLSVKAQTWDAYGHPLLATLYSVSSLHAHSTRMSATTPPEQNAELEIYAYFRLAELATTSGEYALASKLSHMARDRFVPASTSPLHRVWVFADLKLQYMAASITAHTGRALRLARQMASVCQACLQMPFGERAETEIPDFSPAARRVRVYTSCCVALELAKSRLYEEALSVIEAVRYWEEISLMGANHDPLCIYVLLCECEVMILSRQAAKASLVGERALAASLALPHLRGMLARARILLSRAYLDSGHPTKARLLLQHAYEYALEHGSQVVRVEIGLLRAKYKLLTLPSGILSDSDMKKTMFVVVDKEGNVSGRALLQEIYHGLDAALVRCRKLQSLDLEVMILLLLVATSRKSGENYRCEQYARKCLSQQEKLFQIQSLW